MGKARVEMGIKTDSKTHYKKLFGFFYAPFIPRLGSKFPKNANMTQKFVFKKSFWVLTQNFMLSSNP